MAFAPQSLLVTVNGTGVADPFGPGFSSDIGRLLTSPWWAILAQLWGPGILPNIYWQPIGYRAAVFPMNPSVTEAVQEIDRQITLHENPEFPGYCPVGWPIFLSGYSQGAIATAIFLRDYVLPLTGKHHNRLYDIVLRGGVIQLGDPMRTPGIAHGNEVAGLPVPKILDGVISGGIAGPQCLTPAQTDIAGQPPFYLSCALDGDLYACAPVGPPAGSLVLPTGAPWVNEPLVGQVETRIYGFVQSGSLLQGIMSIAEGVAQEFEYPLRNTIALCQAIFNGMKFAAAGTNAPHWLYGPFVPYMAQWVLDRSRASQSIVVPDSIAA